LFGEALPPARCQNFLVPVDRHYRPVTIDRLLIEAPPSLGKGDEAKFLWFGEYSRFFLLSLSYFLLVPFTGSITPSQGWRRV